MGGFSVSCDKDELERDFRGEYVNADAVGLDEEGYAQRWLELNPEDTVIMRDGTTRTAGGG